MAIEKDDIESVKIILESHRGRIVEAAFIES
jgi:hypothetical protein